MYVLIVRNRYWFTFTCWLVILIKHDGVCLCFLLMYVTGLLFWICAFKHVDTHFCVNTICLYCCILLKRTNLTSFVLWCIPNRSTSFLAVFCCHCPPLLQAVSVPFGYESHWLYVKEYEWYLNYWYTALLIFYHYNKVPFGRGWNSWPVVLRCSNQSLFYM